eukprot:GEMP01039795.1.p1 GENE.GEMP01039795.1~~GEMP01039795.1.p1  ORF type:complete len:390 (+),score=94.85 GEMP01039795.1:78-1247(+)
MTGSDATKTSEPPSKKAKTTDWETHDGVTVKTFGDTSPTDVVFAFDMDSTLISTKSGSKFPKDADDWTLWHPTVTEVLHKKLAEDGSKKRVVIFTNQGGILKGKTKLTDITTKIEGLVAELKLTSAAAFIIAADNFNRKPATGSWTMFCEKFNGGIVPDLTKSVYVGDAAGRPQVGKRKKDFSDGDLKFALNIGLPFMTPEQFFFNDSGADVPKSFAFDPRTLGTNPTPMPIGPITDLEVMIMVGAPGSGKSTLAKTVFESYEIINRDTLKTKEKCLAAAEKALQNKRNIVIDNQNKQVSDRAPYIALAKKYGAKVRALIVDVPKDYCFHANAYRSFITPTDKVPSMIIHSFYKNLQKPTDKECDAIFQYSLEHLKVGAGHEKIRLFLV